MAGGNLLLSFPSPQGDRTDRKQSRDPLPRPLRQWLWFACRPIWRGFWITEHSRAQKRQPAYIGQSVRYPQACLLIAPRGRWNFCQEPADLADTVKQGLWVQLCSQKGSECVSVWKEAPPAPADASAEEMVSLVKGSNENQHHKVKIHLTVRCWVGGLGDKNMVTLLLNIVFYPDYIPIDVHGKKSWWYKRERRRKWKQHAGLIPPRYQYTCGIGGKQALN